MALEADRSPAETRDTPPLQPGRWVRFETGPLTGVATLMFLVAVGIMLSEAVGRAFFDHSSFWAEEAVRFLVVWAFFLTLGAAGSAGYHIRSDLLVMQLSHRQKLVAGALAALAGLGFATVLVIGSIPQIQRYFTMGMTSDSNLELPMWLVFLAMPLGATFLAIFYLRLLARAVRGIDPFADDDDGAAGKF